MDFKLFGGILLIVGTSIGAGMLALPIATEQFGFIGSLGLLIGCWALMTVGALLILEVNLWLPTNSNLISMARATIGPIGEAIAWLAYLLLLYSLLCAYIAGGSKLLQQVLQFNHFSFSEHVAAALFTLIFGAVVYFGIRAVDYAMRGLMLLKLGSYFVLVVLLLPFINTAHLQQFAWHHATAAVAVMVTITSFGYAAIVPSLRIYFAGDIQKLRRVIIIGSTIPLLCYIAWDAVIMGVLPLQGAHSLPAIAHARNATGGLLTALITATSQPAITLFAKVFTSVCVLTSFLGVGLCLVDFFADGLKIEKKGGAKVFLQILVFLPPLIIVLFMPNIFVKALEYAGYYCIVLLALLPVWMAWAGRMQHADHSHYRVGGGNFTLLLTGLVCLAVIFLPIWL